MISEMSKSIRITTLIFGYYNAWKVFKRSVNLKYSFNPNKGKYGPEKTTYLDTFHAVLNITYCVLFTVYNQVSWSNGIIYRIYGQRLTDKGYPNCKMTKFEIVWTKVWTFVLLTLLTWHRHLILHFGRPVDGHCLVGVAPLELWLSTKYPTKKMSFQPGTKLIFEIFYFSNHRVFVVSALSILKIQKKK